MGGSGSRSTRNLTTCASATARSARSVALSSIAFPPERFRMLSEWSELSLYEWNTKTATLFLQDVRRLPLPSPAHSTGAMGDQRPLP